MPSVWRNLRTARQLARIEAEVERAQQVQRRLILIKCDLPGFDVAIRFTPCSGVAGDYVDALALPDGRALFVIADVVGKGIPAAMVAVGVQTIVRTAVHRWVGLEDLANTLDAYLAETLQPGAFVTLLAIIIDPRTGAVEAVNGGHPPAMVFSSAAGGLCRSVASGGGVMFGPFPQARHASQARLELSETLTLFTDGYFEVFNEEGVMLDLDGFCELVGGPVADAENASAAANAVINLTDQWKAPGDARDDRTLLMIRRLS